MGTRGKVDGLQFDRKIWGLEGEHVAVLQWAILEVVEEELEPLDLKVVWWSGDTWEDLCGLGLDQNLIFRLIDSDQRGGWRWLRIKLRR